MVARGVGLLVVFACSGKPRPEEASHGAPIAGDATPPGEAAPADVAPGSAAPSAGIGRGDLQVRVEWPDVPVVARSSPGRTPCGTPRAPSVAPTTTWGIPDALVIVEGAAPPLAGAHVTLAECAITPQLAVGAGLAITSAVDRPTRLTLRRCGTLDHVVAGEPVVVMLPIAGHTVTTRLEPGEIYALQTDAADPELAFVAAVPGGYVSDAAGHVLARDLAAGPHAVTAWLPPRGGQPARIGRGTATVTAGELAELTVRLAP